MAELTYETLIQDMNQHMLVTEIDRVAMLRKVLDELQHPELQYKIIHLAGTNGKGSTGTMLADALHHAGNKVGHFASPALLDLREQVTVDDQIISKQAFVNTYSYIVNKLPSDIRASDITIFEWFTLIMLQYFADQQVEWGIIEAGLGGMNDATNAIEKSLLTVFTYIDYDHMGILGNTIKLIAYNKSRIIKPNSTVFVAPKQHAAALAEIEHSAKELQAQAVIQADENTVRIEKESIDGFTVSIDYEGIQLTHQHFNLLGEFQLDNLATVVAVYQWLLDHDYVHGLEALTQTLNSIEIKGRMQIVDHHPLLILDGAHNVDGTQRLIETVQRLLPNYEKKFILGFLKDKQYDKMATAYSTVADQVYTVTPDNPKRALAAADLAKVITSPVEVMNNIEDALETAELTASDNTVIIVTGSFYLIKELEEKK